ncbi:E3 ubiquitin-protein ligase AMFR-like isoform X2 [Leptidea sinapis]|uniref:E3 ubiquitin-protein ligase AMFR-like isoform X2 n=1 Tax=Leptidea sinapis TaxID=189913 RepID=UPI00213326D7|nr:E3 ubiquitin-protein ligase AMFR-like isoform X2 [Leptidea sinapis]
MPVTIIDRLPLPNLKVYSAGSVLLFSVAVYYSVNITSDPNWRVNATLQRFEVDSDGKKENAEAVSGVSPVAFNVTRNLTEQVLEVMTFMMHEPLCMWTLINSAYCALVAAYAGVLRGVFGRLRAHEAQRAKDKLWNYVFNKFMFVFGVLNVTFLDEVLLWLAWSSLVAALMLLTQLCKDRAEYVWSSGGAGGGGRLLLLLLALLLLDAALLGAALRWGLPAGGHTFWFMAAECSLVCVGCAHVAGGWAVRARAPDPAAPLHYYTHLVFDGAALLLETAHVAHMVAHSSALLSMSSLVLLLQLRHLLHSLLARLRRHRVYAALATHMSRNYPMASPEEVKHHEDKCAICWEPMKEARKLPCAHLFHNSCLCRWLQQDASCPSCRRPLSTRPAPHTAGPSQLFHFDGSRYVSWLPSFSVEVTAARSARARGGSELDGRLQAADAADDVVTPGSASARPASARDSDGGAAVRQQQLQRRKQQLLEEARRRYLRRQAD